MITVTQFSTTQLQMARSLLASLPKKPKAAPTPAEAAPETPESQGAPELSEAPPQAQAGEPAAEVPAAAAAAEAPAKAGSAPDAEAVALVMERMSLDEKKAQHLVEALAVAGNRLDRVRSVRVVQLEGAPRNAVKRGEHGYIVDTLMPAGGAARRKGGRGAPRRPRGGEGMGGKPGAHGGKNKGDPNDLSGPFSMDSVKEDRRRESAGARRGRGRPGGGRGRPGGGRGGPGGGGRGVPSGARGGPGGGQGGSRGGPGAPPNGASHV